MSVSFRRSPDPKPRSPIRQDGDNRAIAWTVGVVAVVALFGVSYWAWSERAPVAANPPAVTAAPAPATGVPVPAPETTTGQSPRPAR